MNITIITGDKNRHKNFVNTIHNHFGSVKNVFVYNNTNESNIKKIKRQKSNLFLKALSSIYKKVNFKNEEENKIELHTDIIQTKFNNSKQLLDYSSTFVGTDILLVLGGPIIPNEIITLSKYSLNYHTGISPFFNGTNSTYYTISTGNFQFVGGTLMLLNNKIDGGDILAHYFPNISKDDDYKTIFQNNINGGVELFIRIIKHIMNKKKIINYYVQGEPFDYKRGRDIHILHDLRVKKNINKKMDIKHENNYLEYYTGNSNIMDFLKELKLIK